MSGVILNSTEKQKRKPVMWETPDWLYRWLDGYFHFMLDPCADDNNYKCEWWYSKKINGLESIWDLWGHKKATVYCNPPYNDIAPWAKKAYEEWQNNGVTTVLLIPVNTCTAYFHEYLNKGKVWFFRRRIAFINPETCKEGRENPQSMMLVVFSNEDYQLGDEYGSIDVKEIKEIMSA